MNNTYANETLKTIAERYSCRNFTSECPTDEQLNLIAEAAVAAPSGMNLQPWRVIVVTDKALIDEMEREAMRHLSEAARERINSRGGKMYYNASCVFVIAVSPSISQYAHMDCGILCENITLAAHSLGLSSVICGMSRCAFEGEKAGDFQKRLGIPEGFEFGMSVLIGKAAGSGKPHEPDKSKISFVK